MKMTPVAGQMRPASIIKQDTYIPIVPTLCFLYSPDWYPIEPATIANCFKGLGYLTYSFATGPPYYQSPTKLIGWLFSFSNAW
jgi:hypothetical protein